MAHAIHVEQHETWTIDCHPNPDACFDWMRENWHDLYSWDGENVDSLRGFCEHFGLTDPDWEINLCGPSHAHARVADYDIAELSGVRLWKYLQNSGRLRYYNKFRKESGDLLAGDCPFTGYYTDEDILDPLREFIARPDSRTFQDLIDDCLASWASAFVRDWEDCYSDEGLREMAEANEYEFLESGEFYC